MISEDIYTVYRPAITKADAWILEAINGDTGWLPEVEPDYVKSVTNAIRGEIEHFEHARDKPRRLTLYAGLQGANWVREGGTGTLVNWTGLFYGPFTIKKLWFDRHNTLRCQVVADLPDIGTYTGQWNPDLAAVNLRRVK